MMLKWNSYAEAVDRCAVCDAYTTIDTTSELCRECFDEIAKAVVHKPGEDEGEAD